MARMWKTLLVALTVAFLLVESAHANTPVDTVTVTVSVSDSSSNPLQGATIYYQTGSTTYLFGTTNSSGVATKDLVGGSHSFWAVYNATRSTTITQDVSTNPSVSFQTSLVTLKLQTCDGTGLSGGQARYWVGSTSYWFPGNPTASDGYAYGEFFPGTYKFEMLYKNTAQAITQSIGTPVVFTTTKVTLYWGGSISYGGPAGDYTWFTKPSMELLPGTYKFHFRGGPTLDLTFSGCSFNGGVLTLLDHTGSGLAGGTAKWADGSWHDIPGQTDANGFLWFTVTNPNFNKIAMTFHQGTVEQDRTQLTASGYTWRTVLARIRLLKNDCSTLIPDNPGGDVAQGGGYWESIGNTGPNGGYVDWEVFGGKSYKFRMTYHGASQEMWAAVPVAGGNVDFCTALVKLWFTGNIEMNFGSWGNYYTNPMYLLPVNHPLYFSNATHGRKGPYNLTPTAGTVVEETFAYVTVKKSNGQGQSGVTPTKWWDYGGATTTMADPTDGNGVLLIAMNGKHTNTNVQVFWYGAGSALTFQNPATINSFYDFQLYRASVQMTDNTGAIIASATPNVYFHAYGVTPDTLIGPMSAGKVDIDLMPGSTYFFDIKSYSFNASQGTISGVLNANPKVFAFQTGKVTQGSATCVSYHQYGGPETAFGEPEQLLPGNYYFKMSTGATLNYQVKAGQTLDLSTGSYSTP